MPEPGVRNRNSTRQTSKSVRSPDRWRGGAKRLRKSLKIPREYAEFRLEDGRYLGEVLEPDFFGPESDRVTEQMREELRLGNYAPARYGRDNPERLTVPAAPAMPEGDNDEQFVNLPFGQEEGDAEDSGPRFPVARPRPAKTGAEESDSVRGFRMFDLPFSADGTVDKRALVPGTVYRIPESAGGGTGQWKGGAFYNFDGKADWNFRTAADLDAYAGAVDAPTPVEPWKKVDNALMPAALLDEAGAGEFNEKSGYGLAPADGGYTLTDASGRELFELGEEDAAELARIWSPEIAKMVAAIGLIWREDLTPAEKRRLLAREVYAGEVDVGRVLSRSEYMAHLAKSGERNLARKRLKTYDALAEAMARGASDEEVGALLGEFQAAMLPEVFGGERFVRELLMDLAPGLGNIRSIRHLQNDIAEVQQAIETGKWNDAALASGMAVLDAIGIFPGGNFVKLGGKLAGRGLVKAAPHLDGLLAERTIRRFRAQWRYPKGPVPGAKEFFGEDALAGVTDAQIKSLDGLLGNRFGIAGGEKYLWTLGKRMDPEIDPDIHKQFSVDLTDVPDALSETRKYDLLVRYPSDVLAAKNALAGRLARWFVGAEPRLDPGELLPRALELKTGDKFKPQRQAIPDEYFAKNPLKVPKKAFRGVDDLRMHIEDIPIEFILKDLPRHLENAVSKGKLSRSEKYLLTLAMNRMHANGILGMPVDKYATLLARIDAGAARRYEVENDQDLPAISPYQP